MAVNFDGIPFAVLIGDGELPYPAFDDAGVRTYEPTVLVGNMGRITSLRARLSVVTVLNALGSVGGGIAVIEAGRGAKTLIYPLPDGTESTEAAVLTGLRIVGRFDDDAAWQVDLTFLLLGTATA